MGLGCLELNMLRVVRGMNEICMLVHHDCICIEK